MRIGLILMASGFASRFGANKLLAEVDGIPLIRRAMAAYPPGLFHCAAVVSQYPEILSLAEERGYTAVPNPSAAEGISSSIRMGLAALEGADAALFAVSDQPWLTVDSVQRVLSAPAAAPGSIIALSWRGRKGNPCLFPREFYGELSALTGDRGGGAVISAHPDRLVLVEAGSERELLDVDTPADLPARG
ncbi:nucleotidyltransferase family protein [Pseudoflavonifractor phocaeensis]|uniref:nucleotidyltransferase family protein n=1 Tax=Pseudoflavonifractor phocaeensis TaxID=1870988 RepID=UPI00210D45C2|nr:nucleotidyltransferase family protein [Pseudoflavonifractor phocaeensis]MCQ4865819.1 nucleotidyltransferase family protein [Pseudoflavonifractor phocaeensis]